MKKAIVSVVLLLAVGGGGYLYHDATLYRTLLAIQVSAAQGAAAEGNTQCRMEVRGEDDGQGGARERDLH